jgi:hypothetical protein
MACAAAAAAQTSPADETPIQIRRAAGPITVDGDITDPGWQGAAKVENFFETRPGDNTRRRSAPWAI